MKEAKRRKVLGRNNGQQCPGAKKPSNVRPKYPWKLATE
jgi:hypothetical protein